MAKIVFIGDSTLDNRAWVFPGSAYHSLRNGLGISRTFDPLAYFGMGSSVIRHFKALRPNDEVIDYTNYGFTTTDILQGARRNKVFGKTLADLYPNEFFHVLADGNGQPVEHYDEEQERRIPNQFVDQQPIAEADYIVLSVGGDNIHEFLQDLRAQQGRLLNKTEDTGLEDYIRTELPKFLETLKKEYKQIHSEIRKKNPNAKIIFITPHYPSTSQQDRRIYSLMPVIGEAFQAEEKSNSWFSKPTDPMEDGIHILMKAVYVELFRSIAEEDQNIAIADVTSTLNPFDEQNHIAQIQPSHTGGKTIACLLDTVLQHYELSPTPDHKKARAFSFQGPSTCSRFICYWEPKHPFSFLTTPQQKTCYQLLTQIDQAAQNGELPFALREAYKQVSKEGRHLFNQFLRNPRIIGEYGFEEDNQILELTKSLEHVIGLIQAHASNKKQCIEDLKTHANNHAQGKSIFWKQFIGALLLVAAVAALVFGALYAAPTAVAAGLGIDPTLIYRTLS